ncbi:hypothetical protein C8R46DRAFT_1359529 [Mycena filopes]|nr:hypothetical protein C8R46DRAFT_1359529 [Mycena filopes]
MATQGSCDDDDDDDSIDETFALDAEAGREETVLARMSEHGELLMYGDGDGASFSGLMHGMYMAYYPVLLYLDGSVVLIYNISSYRTTIIQITPPP